MGDHYDKHREADYDRQARQEKRDKYQSERDRVYGLVEQIGGMEVLEDLALRARDKASRGMKIGLPEMAMSQHKTLYHIGNGDTNRAWVLLAEIAERLKHARAKHAVYANNEAQAMNVISSEVEEMEYEIYTTYDDERAQDECLDVIATAIRFKNEEWEK